MKQRNPSDGGTLEEPPLSNDVDSNCSTPYVSAPSSPGRTSPPSAASGYFFSAPASPVHYILSSSAAGNVAKTASASPELLHSVGGSFEFGGAGHSGPMISADELFLNGQIRPMKVSSHLQRPQALLSPLIDLEEEEEQGGENGGRGREVRLRSRSIHRRARSMSPMRNRHQWEVEDEEGTAIKDQGADVDADPKPEDPVTPSASSSRSSSSGRNTKRWIFLKDLLYRSKSEGRARDSNGKEKEKEKSWHLSPAKEKSSLKKKSGNPNPCCPNANGVSNGVGRRRVPTAHERHYTANRAQAEEMRRRTFLPYRQGLLGCLGFSSRGYGAVNGFARTLNPVSSR
ncbi:uncharacterized protein M6B38_148430 [Iris pallida]|uniref:Uncharacterized protein n=1 Tax=Iris pallida TaxID=29817 RepID=A0AAX6F8E0_IRIPA|nr:uncharacterized protein M6B38_148430 [Iris pallida]